MSSLGDTERMLLATESPTSAALLDVVHEQRRASAELAARNRELERRNAELELEARELRRGLSRAKRDLKRSQDEAKALREGTG